MKKQKIIIGRTDAVAVIDGQNDFAHPAGALYSEGFPGEAANEAIIANIQTLAAKPAGYRIATFDRHPDTGHIEFAMYGRHVVEDTWGAEYLRELKPLLDLMDFISYKGADPALISLSVAVSTSFGRMIADMRAKGITRVFVCGWKYTHCVGLSAIAFATQGFEAYVVRDATNSVPAKFGGDPKRMKRQLALDGVKEITMSELSA